MKILYVDDEAINLLLFEKIFQHHFDVSTAISGQDGLSILGSNTNIDLVITDMRMPLMNGLEFIKEAIDQGYHHIPFCILTGFDLNKDIQEYMNKGLIRKYFQKPFDKSTIIDGVNDVIDNH